jgi:hypothetical protein
MTGRLLDERLGKSTGPHAGLQRDLLPMFWLGLAGMRRRVADHPAEFATSTCWRACSQSHRCPSWSSSSTPFVRGLAFACLPTRGTPGRWRAGRIAAAGRELRAGPAGHGRPLRLRRAGAPGRRRTRGGDGSVGWGHRSTDPLTPPRMADRCRARDPPARGPAVHPVRGHGSALFAAYFVLRYVPAWLPQPDVERPSSLVGSTPCCSSEQRRCSGLCPASPGGCGRLRRGPALTLVLGAVFLFIQHMSSRPTVLHSTAFGAPSTR